MRTLELLAPAKNLECGRAAIDHGADAVYIGASRFGAREAAGNPLGDIRELADHAHRFGAKVYATVNTIVYDNEMDDALRLVDDLREAGVDALLVQDMGLASAVRGRMTLHASTQTDNRTARKVAWLHAQGFKRVVLARELTLDEVAAIHRAVPDVELEVFVHGALCVSYSGLCYASQYCFGRSANRGECAQFCRLKFDLLDANGRELVRQRHLLSLKDLCQIDELEALADAGAVSFKIEGRLKDVDYVKNVVAAYSQQLDRLIAKRPEDYQRASRGRVEYHFQSVLEKTFNRGFTHYFLHGRRQDIASPDTPKAMGERVGTVKDIGRDTLTVAGTASFANGDGLCFINAERELEGFRVNRAEGNRLHPYKMPAHLRKGMRLWRNHDVAFDKLLSGQTAVRKMPVQMDFALTDGGFRLRMTGAASVEVTCDFAHQPAQKPQRDNIVRQLTRLGDTIYVCDHLQIEPWADRYFIPSSLLADLRRRGVARLVEAEQSLRHTEEEDTGTKGGTWEGHPPSPAEVNTAEYAAYPYLYNVANRQARDFYDKEGLSLGDEGRAFELQGLSRKPADNPLLLMQCRHCLRYMLGHCVRHGGTRPTWREPLSLRLADGRTFRLQFQCDTCQMNVYAEK